MSNATLGEIYPIVVQLISDSTNFTFDPSQITINADESYVTIYNSRGGLLRDREPIFYDPIKLLIGYNWKTSDFSSQEFYTFTFTISITYTPLTSKGELLPDNSETFMLTTRVVKALQTNSIFSSNTVGD